VSLDQQPDHLTVH